MPKDSCQCRPKILLVDSKPQNFLPLKLMIKKHQVDTDIVKQYKDIQSKYTLRYDVEKD